TSSVSIEEYRKKCYDAMNDDFNSPILIAHLFDITKVINSVNDKKATLTQADIDKLKGIFDTFVFDILGLKDEQSGDNTTLLDGLISMILEVRQQAKSQKDWATSDRIRDDLQKLGVAIKDGKDGATWTIE
ncbi:MAG: cysteine--tRNA ligase, partial [Bacteroidales bacterium]|nr:cysteine--tRNA ligase [Bacteroidales bacterium]